MGERVGFDFGSLDDSLVARMVLLASVSQTTADALRMVRGAEAVFAYYERTKPRLRWDAVERRTVVLACIFSDVGKSGPLHASPDEQRLVAEMFAVEGVKDEAQTIASFLAQHFPTEAQMRVARFRALGLDPSMSVRAFWNHHAGWTYDLVEAGGVPPEAVAAAATHHLLDGINPEGVVCADGRFSRWFGENVGFDRAEKLVIVLDKYDATRRRGSLTHDEAIVWLRARIAKRPAFRDDAELDGIVDDVDAALRDT